MSCLGASGGQACRMVPSSRGARRLANSAARAEAVTLLFKARLQPPKVSRSRTSSQRKQAAIASISSLGRLSRTSGGGGEGVWRRVHRWPGAFAAVRCEETKKKTGFARNSGQRERET